MNFFYGVYPADKKLARLFDLARLILQPDYARKAHITLRGPYENRPSHRSKWLGYQLPKISLTKPDTFFNDWQNTVFLRAEFIDAKDISWKKDYANGVPHMSLYDGEDRRLAWQVLMCLRNFSWNIDIEPTPVVILERKKKGYAESVFIEIDDVDLAFEYISQRPLSRNHIQTMHIGQRVDYLDRICRAIHDFTHPSSTPR